MLTYMCIHANYVACHRVVQTIDDTGYNVASIKKENNCKCYPLDKHSSILFQILCYFREKNMYLYMNNLHLHSKKRKKKEEKEKNTSHCD